MGYKEDKCAPRCFQYWNVIAYLRLTGTGCKEVVVGCGAAWTGVVQTQDLEAKREGRAGREAAPVAPL